MKNNKNKIKNLLLRFQIQFRKSKKHFIKTTLNGVFWLAPIVAIFMIISWLYGKADIVAGGLFKIVGLTPSHHFTLWTILGITILGLGSFLVGVFIETGFGIFVRNKLEDILKKIPGFSNIGHNIGIMYSTKEGIVKNHYTVTIPTTPISFILPKFLKHPGENENHLYQKVLKNSYLIILCSSCPL